jgi:uncharacterized protein YbjT (DUF2867 family)
MSDVLVVGASGYIGGRLVQRLLELGVAVRAAGRDPDRLRSRWARIDAVEMDVLDPNTIDPATDGISVAYYLVHSMSEGEEGFAERDRRAAANFGAAALASGVGLVVYLGGLGRDEDDLSPHLASRHETGAVLARTGPPLVELRAGIVIGAGSASFRMLKDLVKRLPVMITPRWVETRSQPIAVDDVVEYLEQARHLAPPDHHTVIEIGGADVLSYREMMQRVGGPGKRTPRIVSVPVLTPYLSSLWCGLVTSVPASIARPLIEGQRNETIVRSDAAARCFPNVHPVGLDGAVRRAGHERAIP